MMDNTVAPFAAALGRRALLRGGSAAFAMGLLGGPAFAAHRTGPGGFSKDALQKIPEALQGFVDHGVAIGIVTLLYRHGEIAQVNAVGQQDREANLPMKRDAIFRIASMSKPVTAAAMLTLIEQGKIGLMDPIDKWIPEFANPKVLNKPDGALKSTHPAPRGITVLDLLTHRSGLCYPFTAQGPLAAALQKDLSPEALGSNPTFDEWLKRLSALPLAYDPGTRWNYGLSIDMAGALIQRVSGKSFGEYLKAAIFDPLGMQDTGFWLPKEKQSRLAAVYGVDFSTGKRPPVARPIPDTAPNFASGGGGLVSTADDYLKFARMLLGKGRSGDARILSHPAVERMTSNWLTPAQRAVPAMGNPDFFAGQGFGLGLSIIDDITKLGFIPFGSKGSIGWAGAYGTWWQADPAEDMVAIYMAQNAIEMNPSVKVDAKTMQAGMAQFYKPQRDFTTLIYQAIDD
jgi:CubicO group peptidase (beta-lactamase class C family)